MINKNKFLNFKQSDFSKPSEEEFAIGQLMQAANYAHQNYIFVNKGTFSQETIEKVREAGYNVLIGYGDIARIKISW